MTQERIDIEAYTQIFEADDGITEEQLVAFGLSAISELKRCYDTMDTAVANLKELFEVTESSEVQSIANYLEGTTKPCDCEDPDYAYYWHDASGCLTVIHGAAECTECGKAWDATQEGNWTIHFDRPTDNPYTG